MLELPLFFLYFPPLCCNEIPSVKRYTIVFAVVADSHMAYSKQLRSEHKGKHSADKDVIRESNYLGTLLCLRLYSHLLQLIVWLRRGTAVCHGSRFEDRRKRSTFPFLPMPVNSTDTIFPHQKKTSHKSNDIFQRGRIHWIHYQMFPSCREKESTLMWRMTTEAQRMNCRVQSDFCTEANPGFLLCCM